MIKNDVYLLFCIATLLLQSPLSMGAKPPLKRARIQDGSVPPISPSRFSSPPVYNLRSTGPNLGSRSNSENQRRWNTSESSRGSHFTRQPGPRFMPDFSLSQSSASREAVAPPASSRTLPITRIDLETDSTDPGQPSYLAKISKLGIFGAVISYFFSAEDEEKEMEKEISILDSKDYTDSLRMDSEDADIFARLVERSVRHPRAISTVKSYLHRNFESIKTVYRFFDKLIQRKIFNTELAYIILEEAKKHNKKSNNDSGRERLFYQLFDPSFYDYILLTAQKDTEIFWSLQVFLGSNEALKSEFTQRVDALHHQLHYPPGNSYIIRLALEEGIPNLILLSARTMDQELLAQYATALEKCHTYNYEMPTGPSDSKVNKLLPWHISKLIELGSKDHLLQDRVLKEIVSNPKVDWHFKVMILEKSPWPLLELERQKLASVFKEDAFTPVLEGESSHLFSPSHQWDSFLSSMIGSGRNYPDEMNQFFNQEVFSKPLLEHQRPLELVEFLNSLGSKRFLNLPSSFYSSLTFVEFVRNRKQGPIESHRVLQAITAINNHLLMVLIQGNTSTQEKYEIAQTLFRVASSSKQELGKKFYNSELKTFLSAQASTKIAAIQILEELFQERGSEVVGLLIQARVGNGGKVKDEIIRIIPQIYRHSSLREQEFIQDGLVDLLTAPNQKIRYLALSLLKDLSPNRIPVDIEKRMDVHTPEEKAAWKMTDPRKHDPQNFRYLIHSVAGPGVKRILTGKTLFENPEDFLNRKYIHTSIIDQENVGTMFPIGVILEVPLDNIAATFPMNASTNKRYIPKSNKILIPQEILKGNEQAASLTDGAVNWNEVVIYGTNPYSGKTVKIVGAFIAVTENERDLCTTEETEKVEKFTKENRLPLVRIVRPQSKL